MIFIWIYSIEVEMEWNLDFYFALSDGIFHNFIYELSQKLTIVSFVLKKGI
jgi:hypothetical protein